VLGRFWLLAWPTSPSDECCSDDDGENETELSLASTPEGFTVYYVKPYVKRMKEKG
jgi:hypothetical protein